MNGSEAMSLPFTKANTLFQFTIKAFSMADIKFSYDSI